jgi:hypothetical protein
VVGLITLIPFATLEFAYSQQSPGDELRRRVAEEWSKVPYESAQKYYPSVFTSLTLPDEYTLLFILRDKQTVLKHDAATIHVPPAGEPITKLLERAFPGVNVPLNAQQGGKCFAPVPGKHAKFCVLYAVLP